MTICIVFMQGLFVELANNMDDGFLLCWVGLGGFVFYVKCMWGGGVWGRKLMLYVWGL